MIFGEKSRSIKIFEKDHRGIFKNGYYFFAIYSETSMHSKIKYTFSDKNIGDVDEDLFKRPKLLQRKSMPHNPLKKLVDLNNMDPVKIMSDMRNIFYSSSIK